MLQPPPPPTPTPTPTPAPPALTVTVSPDKAGTEAAPNAVTLKLNLTGELSGTTMTIFFPKGLRISNTGLPTCALPDKAILAGRCKSAKAGTGTFTTPTGDTLNIKPFTGATDLTFRIGDHITHGTLSQATGPYTAKLRLKLPRAARHLTALTLTLTAKRASNSLFATRACPLPFKVTLGTTLTTKAPCTS